MEQQQTKQNGGGNGFIFGVILGVAIALLFTTKKGRAILRDMSEKVINKLSKLEQIAKQSQEEVDLLDDFTDEDDYVKPQPQPAPQPKPASAQPVVKEEKKEVPPKETEKPVEKDTELESAPEEKSEEKQPEPQPEPEEEPQVKAPTKVIHGRRWFRGLKKRGQ